jgi:hypothetical protein
LPRCYSASVFISRMRCVKATRVGSSERRPAAHHGIGPVQGSGYELRIVFSEVRPGLLGVASCSERLMSTRNPPGRTGMLRLSAAILLIGSPILALIFRSWGVGSMVFGPRGYRAGDSTGSARRASQRTLPWGWTLAWRYVHRDRGLGTPAVRSGTLAHGVPGLFTERPSK